MGWGARGGQWLSDKAFGLPGPRRPFRVDRGVRTALRDGTELVADHYVPLTDRPKGTLLVRTPYPRGLPDALLYGQGWAARGYHVLLQSVRGRYGSGGDFDPMAGESADGRDTVAWLREQPWFDGRLGTFGGSYLGWTQWALLLDPPPELRAAVIIAGPHDMAESVWSGGAFALGDFFRWSDLVAHQEDQRGRLRSIPERAAGERRIQAAEAELPLLPATERVLAGRAPWFERWFTHPGPAGGFWRPYRLGAALATVDVPVLLTGGWQDIFLRQTLHQYEVLRGRGLEVALTVGPWTHTGLVTAARRMGAEGLAWFEQHLAGPDADPDGRPPRPAPVLVTVTGGGGTAALPAWPPATAEHVLFTGPAATLTGEPPAAQSVPSVFRTDPADPTPAVGGRVLAPGAGRRRNEALEARPDVLAFSTEPLPADLDVTGAPVLELALGRDNPHADLFARLCDVDRRGRSWNVADGFVRLDPAGTTGTVRLQLDPCAHRFRRGHRLRLQVSGGAHPRWARSTGTAEPVTTATAARGCGYEIAHGASRLVLPVPVPAENPAKGNEPDM